MSNFNIINIEILKETKRHWDYTKDSNIIKNLILVKLNKKSLYLYLKNSHPPAEFIPVEEKENGIEFNFNPSIKLEKEQEVILYLDLKKHLEFHFKVHSVSNGFAILVPEILKVSKFERKYERIPVKDEEVFANNFRVNKNKITANNIQFQITAKIIFPQIEEKYASKWKGLKILLINAENLPEALKKQEIDSPKFIKINTKSVLVYPILVFQKNKFSPIAYIIYPMDDLPNEEEKTNLLIEFEKIADETFEKILEANTILIKSKQKVVNISEGGVALEIKDPELKKLILYQESITFDLVFKLVAPLRMHGEIKYIHKIKKDNEEYLLIGIDFTGEGYTEFRKKNKELLKSLIKKLTT